LGNVLGSILSKEKQAEIINNFYNSSPTLNQNNEVDMSVTQTLTNSTVHGSVVAAEKSKIALTACKHQKQVMRLKLCWNNY
jgi:hypothetical protein